MRTLKLAVLAAGVVLAASSINHVAAGDLPSTVQQQVVDSVGVWASSGSIKSLSASIADLCRDNPGIALDIVAYAGEFAAKSMPTAECRPASQCSSLDELLAWLQQRAAFESGTNGTRRAKQAPPPACTGSDCEPPSCTALLGCGPPQPVSKSAI